MQILPWTRIQCQNTCIVAFLSVLCIYLICSYLCICFSIAFALFCWVFRGWILDIGGENVTKLPFCLSKHTSISLVFVCLVYLVLNARAQFRNRLYFCRFFFAFFSLASSDFSFLLFSLFSRKGLVTFWYHLRSCYLCQAHHLTKIARIDIQSSYMVSIGLVWSIFL